MIILEECELTYEQKEEYYFMIARKWAHVPRLWSKYWYLSRIFHYLATIKNGKMRGRSARKMRAYHYGLQHSRQEYRKYARG